MLKSIERMLEKLASQDILYCQWKSNEHIVEALEGETDLDMLFSPRQRGQIERVLSECGLRRFRAVPLMQYNAVEDYIGLDIETAKIWHVHLHYRLTMGEAHLKGYTAPWADYVLKNRIYHASYGIYCSSPPVEAFLLLTRIALKYRHRDLFCALGEEDIREIRWLCKRAGKEEIIETAVVLLGKEAARPFAALLELDLKRKRQFRDLQIFLRASMQSYTAYNVFSAFFTRVRRELFWLVGGILRRVKYNSCTPYRRISPAGGAVVALLGSDGAGKSTTVAYLKKEFGKKMDLMSVYMGSGDGDVSWLRKPLRFFAKRWGGKGLRQRIEKEASAQRKSSLRRKCYMFAKIIWALALAWEKSKRLKCVAKARNNGMLVIADRYPQVSVPGYNDGPLLGKYTQSESRLLRFFCRWEYAIYKSAYANPPDLTIKLMVPLHVALVRKPEMTEADILAKQTAVRLIEYGTRSVVIHTDCTIQQSAGEIMGHIWNEI